MNDLSSHRRLSLCSALSPMVIAIVFVCLMLIGLVVLMVLYAGGNTMDADDSVYIDGKLKTIINYNADTPQEVWVQYTIYRENGLLIREKVGETYSTRVILSKGLNLVEYATPLSTGTYKVFTYISTTDETPKRMTGFISTVEI